MQSVKQHGIKLEPLSLIKPVSNIECVTVSGKEDDPTDLSEQFVHSSRSEVYPITPG